MYRAILYPLLAFLTLQALAQSAVQSPECHGVIHGAVFDLSGRPAARMKLTAWPLGVNLATILPSVLTDEAGRYRFEHLCRGRYTVLPDDKKAGYSYLSPHMYEFLYGKRVAEVKLTSKATEAELRVALPPKPGLIQVHVVNRVTRADVPKFSVTLRTRGQHEQQIEYEFNPTVSGREIPVPPDRHFMLHVTAEGFRELERSARNNKAVIVHADEHSNVEVEVEPVN